VVVAAPILYLLSPVRLQKMAVGAVNGGLIPWQAGIATRAGRLQMVLGREVGVSIFRNGGDHPFPLPTQVYRRPIRPLSASTPCKWSFPVFEYRLFRTFSVNQSSALTLQPYVGFDTPTAISVVSPQMQLVRMGIPL